MISTKNFDAAISSIGIVLNSLALEAVVTGKFCLKGYRRFLISLLISDLCICVVNVLLFILQTVSEYNDIGSEAYKCLAEVGRSLEIISLTANLLNLCGMSVDHFIGIVYPLKYKYISNTTVAKAAVYILWTLSLVVGFADYPIRALAFLKRSPPPSSVDVLDAYKLQHNCTFNVTSSVTAESGPTTSNDFAQEDIVDGIKFEMFDMKELSELFSSVLNSSVMNDPCVNVSSIAELQRHQNTDPDEMYSSVSWCAYFDGSYKVWLEIIVMSLSVVSLIFLGACYGRVFREAVGKADNSKHRLRKLVLTTILLLGTFVVCWVPFVTYEVAMALVFQWKHGNMIVESTESTELFFFVHNILHSLCITCSPLLVPIIYAARIRAVQRRFMEHYGCLMPSSLKRYIGSFSDRRSDHLDNEHCPCGRRSFSRMGSHDDLVTRGSDNLITMHNKHYSHHHHHHHRHHYPSLSHDELTTRSMCFKDDLVGNGCENTAIVPVTSPLSNKPSVPPKPFSYIDDSNY